MLEKIITITEEIGVESVMEIRINHRSAGSLPELQELG